MSFPRKRESSLSIKDKSEAAYRRGDLLEKRRKLAETWAAFATSPGANVIRLRAKKT